MTYVYLKKGHSSANKSSFSKRLTKPTKKKLAILLFVAGIVLLSSAVYPILSFSLKYTGQFSQILSPLSTKFYNQGTLLGQTDIDYTHLSNWFVQNDQANLSQTTSASLKPYTISIPKLKINQAKVVVGGDDLKKSLVQYPNTATPGQLGNTVIFGHSVLPQFFNPKSYLTIFSTLFKLDQGDEIFVDYDNVNYKYVVEQMFEVQPSDLTVLEQRYDGRFLSIITCSPPGTYLKRLIIKAKIVDI